VASLRGESSNQLLETLEEWNDYLDRYSAPPTGVAILNARRCRVPGLRNDAYCRVMNELIYNQWHFPRPELAKSYLEMLTKGAGDPIALQCPRRWGKTTFLLNEMSAAANDAGFLCVYIDVWQNRSDVLGAINYGLQEAIDDLDVPKSVVAKRQ
jgi:hypothetical protein